MRARSARTGMNLSAIVDTMAILQPREPGIALRLHAVRDGAKAAGWLIWQCRKLFERSGEVDFKIPKDEESPGYIRVAIAFLQLSPRHRDKWVVITFVQGDQRVYRVRWTDFDYYRDWRLASCPTRKIDRSRTDPDGLPRTSRAGTPRVS